MTKSAKYIDLMELTDMDLFEACKFKGRATRWNPLVALVVTFVEALLTLTFVRFVWRALKRLAGLTMGRRAVAT